MNTRKLIYWIRLIVFSIATAYVVPVVFDLIQTGKVVLTTRGLKDALFLGLIVPFVVFVSKNIKNDYFTVFIALLTVLTVVLIFNKTFL